MPKLISKTTFLEFLYCPKNKGVVWWYKNGDSGSEYFSISYKNPYDMLEELEKRVKELEAKIKRTS